MVSQRPKRRSKLVRGSFQLRLAASFVGLAALALLLQFLVLAFRVSAEASQLEGPGGQLAEEVPLMLLQVFGFTVAVLLPVVFAVAALMTFRIVGPIHRFKLHLQAVAEGEETEPCRIRENDQLQDLCELINRATEPVRERNAAAGRSPAGSRELRSVG